MGELIKIIVLYCITLSLSPFALYSHIVINSKNKTVENNNGVDYELLLARTSSFYMGKFWQKVAGKGLARAHPQFFRKIVEIERFTLRAAILDDCQI